MKKYISQAENYLQVILSVLLLTYPTPIRSSLAPHLALQIGYLNLWILLLNFQFLPYQSDSRAVKERPFTHSPLVGEGTYILTSRRFRGGAGRERKVLSLLDMQYTLGLVLLF